MKIKANKAFALNPKDWWITDNETNETLDDWWKDFCLATHFLSDCGDRIICIGKSSTTIYKTGIKGLCDNPDDDKII
jgi:hypothetical protein